MTYATYAVIDVGSNTIRLLAYKYTDGNLEEILSDKETAGLSGYVEDGTLSEKGIGVACGVLSKFKKRLAEFGIKNLSVFATASLRNIVNTDEAVSLIKDRTGIAVDVLSGEEEAALDFIGATHSLDVTEGAVIDIGGGSPELVAFADNKILAASSMPIGSLNLYLKHVDALLPTARERRHIEKITLKELTALNLCKKANTECICGVGGTVRATLKLCNDIFDLPAGNRVIETDMILSLLERFKTADKPTIRKIVQIVPDRIHTVLPGMIVLGTLCKKLGGKQVLVSKYGAREGYLYKNILKKE